MGVELPGRVFVGVWLLVECLYEEHLLDAEDRIFLHTAGG
jgi:hypothetical protein